MTKTLTLPSSQSAVSLSGLGQENLAILGKEAEVQVTLRGLELILSGSEAGQALAEEIVYLLRDLWKEGGNVGRPEMLSAKEAILTGRQEEFLTMLRTPLAHNRRGDIIRARTLKQWRYVQSILHHDLTFGLGPAGTGKTYLAAVQAFRALKEERVERIILTRPAVEAGEKLGFLPGDLQAKVNPYLRPLYDALYEFIDPEQLPKLMERGVVEVAPLAYMRGRTLNRAFVILDEAQNATPEQMKMVLTRLGFGSKMVVNGDLTQTDLVGRASGLALARRVLSRVQGISFCMFDSSDVVRHPLVMKIVEAYEAFEAKPDRNRGER
jgi:phosphate starvation-inducible protein PhoH and related proteins